MKFLRANWPIVALGLVSIFTFVALDAVAVEVISDKQEQQLTIDNPQYWHAGDWEFLWPRDMPVGQFLEECAAAGGELGVAQAEGAELVQLYCRFEDDDFIRAYTLHEKK